MANHHKRTADERRVVAIIRSMPQKVRQTIGVSDIERTFDEGHPILMSMVGDYLSEVRDVLVGMEKDEREREKELDQIKGDLLAAGRIVRLMGIRK